MSDMPSTGNSTQNVKNQKHKVLHKVLKWIGFFIINVFIIYVGITWVTIYDVNKLVQKIPNKIATNIEFELELVGADLETYGTLSKKVENKITNAIKINSAKYNIPIGLLHCIFRVESEYRFYIDHPTVTVSVHGKRVTTHAIGLGGIMWCFWGDSLIAKNIAEKESDLYIPEINVEAAAYILSVIINQEIKTASTHTILSRIITRYYGAYDQLYMNKTVIITSDLWLKRMSQEIINSKKKEKEKKDE